METVPPNGIAGLAKKLVDRASIEIRLSEERTRQTNAARELVAEQFSREAAAQRFEAILVYCLETRVAR